MNDTGRPQNKGPTTSRAEHPESSPAVFISVVIPVWKDASALDRLLPALVRQWPANAIWVVDGGSQDCASDVAKRHGVKFLEVDTPSRSRQMNAGAAACGGDVILFLHADTHLPEGARALIAETISGGAIGGAFSRRFDNRSLFLRFTCLTADWRGQIFGAFFGDQAIFTTRNGFERAGRFPNQPLFEDFEFTRRLSRHGRMTLLKPAVISSGRRFRTRGPIRQTLSDFALTIRYAWAGPAILDDSIKSKSPTRVATSKDPQDPNGVPPNERSSPSPAILLFLKAPIPGQVKTRLARDLGDERACAIYRQMVQRQVADLPANWPVEIHFSPASARTELVAWLGLSYAYFSQTDGDLGARLRTATESAFSRGHRSVILIGGDCPDLGAESLEETARLLQHDADAVLGPATDGGYYLLGLRACPESLHVFDEIPWSTPTVARDTIERIRSLGLCLAQLTEREDVDDLAAYRRAVAAGNVQECSAERSGETDSQKSDGSIQSQF